MTLVEFTYAYLIHQGNKEKAVEQAVSEGEMTPESLQIVEYIIDNFTELKEQIEKHISATGTGERLPLLEKCVMFVAIAESKVGKTPRAVAIDQALITIHNYSDQDNVSFVNAILEKVIEN